MSGGCNCSPFFVLAVVKTCKSSAMAVTTKGTARSMALRVEAFPLS